MSTDKFTAIGKVTQKLSFKAVLIALIVVGCALAYGFKQIKQGGEDAIYWSVMMVASVTFVAPVIAVFIINLPSWITIWRANRAPKLMGHVFDGVVIDIMLHSGHLWADAYQASHSIREKPQLWVKRFYAYDKSAIRVQGGKFWVRRDAWYWRFSRDNDLSMRRLFKSLEQDGFGAIDRANEQALQNEINMKMLGDPQSQKPWEYQDKRRSNGDKNGDKVQKDND